MGKIRNFNFGLTGTLALGVVVSCLAGPAQAPDVKRRVLDAARARDLRAEEDALRASLSDSSLMDGLKALHRIIEIQVERDDYPAATEELKRFSNITWRYIGPEAAADIVSKWLEEWEGSSLSVTDRAELLTTVAAAKMNAGKREDALVAFGEVLELIQGLKTARAKSLLSEVKESAGTLLIGLGRHRDAAVAFREAADSACEGGDECRERQALLMMKSVDAQAPTTDFPSGLRLYRELLPKIERVFGKKHIVTARVLCDVAAFSKRTGDLSGWKSSLAQAREIVAGVPDPLPLMAMFPLNLMVDESVSRGASLEAVGFLKRLDALLAAQGPMTKQERLKGLARQASILRSAEKFEEASKVDQRVAELLQGDLE